MQSPLNRWRRNLKLSETSVLSLTGIRRRSWLDLVAGKTAEIPLRLRLFLRKVKADVGEIEQEQKLFVAAKEDRERSG